MSRHKTSRFSAGRMSNPLLSYSLSTSSVNSACTSKMVSEPSPSISPYLPSPSRSRRGAPVGGSDGGASDTSTVDSPVPISTVSSNGGSVGVDEEVVRARNDRQRARPCGVGGSLGDSRPGVEECRRGPLDWVAPLVGDSPGDGATGVGAVPALGVAERAAPDPRGPSAARGETDPTVAGESYMS